MDVAYYTAASGRSPPREEIAAISEPLRASIRADVYTLAEHGHKGPIRTKPITGHLPMWEIITGGYRTFYYLTDGKVVVLHACAKQRQKQGINIAYRRMKELMEV